MAKVQDACVHLCIVRATGYWVVFGPVEPGGRNSYKLRPSGQALLSLKSVIAPQQSLGWKKGVTNLSSDVQNLDLTFSGSTGAVDAIAVTMAKI